jgi:hypothetical protein
MKMLLIRPTILCTKLTTVLGARCTLRNYEQNHLNTVLGIINMYVWINFVPVFAVFVCKERFETSWVEQGDR